MLGLLQLAFFMAALVAVYLYWVCPILRSVPALAEVYATTESWFEAVQVRFQGIKAKLAVAIGKAVAAIVVVHDFVMPYAVGVDWTPIRSYLPDWAWPLILFAMFSLIGWFRSLTDRRISP